MRSLLPSALAKQLYCAFFQFLFLFSSSPGILQVEFHSPSQELVSFTQSFVQCLNSSLAHWRYRLNSYPPLMHLFSPPCVFCSPFLKCLAYQLKFGWWTFPMYFWPERQLQGLYLRCLLLSVSPRLGWCTGPLSTSAKIENMNQHKTEKQPCQSSLSFFSSLVVVFALLCDSSSCCSEAGLLFFVFFNSNLSLVFTAFPQKKGLTVFKTLWTPNREFYFSFSICFLNVALIKD